MSGTSPIAAISKKSRRLYSYHTYATLTEVSALLSNQEAYWLWAFDLFLAVFATRIANTHLIISKQKRLIIEKHFVFSIR
jgi:hypothetical protein